MLVNLHQCLCSVRTAWKAVQICTAVLRRLPYSASVLHIDLHTSVITLYVSDYFDSYWFIRSANCIALPLWQHSASFTMHGVMHNVELSCADAHHIQTKTPNFDVAQHTLLNMTAANTYALVCMQQQLCHSTCEPKALLQTPQHQHQMYFPESLCSNVIYCIRNPWAKHYTSPLCIHQKPRPTIYNAAANIMSQIYSGR